MIIIMDKLVEVLAVVGQEQMVVQQVLQVKVILVETVAKKYLLNQVVAVVEQIIQVPMVGR